MILGVDNTSLRPTVDRTDLRTKGQNESIEVSENQGVVEKGIQIARRMEGRRLSLASEANEYSRSTA